MWSLGSHGPLWSESVPARHGSDVATCAVFWGFRWGEKKGGRGVQRFWKGLCGVNLNVPIRLGLGFFVERWKVVFGCERFKKGWCNIDLKPFLLGSQTAGWRFQTFCLIFSPRTLGFSDPNWRWFNWHLQGPRWGWNTRENHRRSWRMGKLGHFTKRRTWCTLYQGFWWVLVGQKVSVFVS